MDKTGAKKRRSPYAVRLYAKSKPLNTMRLFCGSKQVKKNGTRDGKQRYKCTACNKRFSGGKSQALTPFSSITTKASKPPHSTDAASKLSAAILPKQS